MNKKSVISEVLLHFLQGFLVGSGAILPGISGGALCLSFGYYFPMIEIIANPVKGIKKHFRLLLPFGLGWLAAFFVCAKLIGVVFELFEVQSTLLFAGLIAGSFLPLYREAGRGGRSNACHIGFISAFTALTALLLVFYLTKLTVTPGPLWNAFIGVLWGMSLVFPGLNSTPITMALGIFEPWSAGVGSFDLAVIVPWLAALAVTAFALSRTVSGLVKKRFAVVSHVMLGVVTSSTAMTLIIMFMSRSFTFIELAVSVILFAAGWLMSSLMDKWSDSVTKKENNQ